MNTDPSDPKLPNHEALPEPWLKALRSYPSEQGNPGAKADAEILSMASKTFATMRRPRRRVLLWSSLAAAACLVLSLLSFLQPNTYSDGETAMSTEDDYSVILREVSAVFPHQVKSIVSDGSSLEIALTEEPHPADKQAVVIEFCEQNTVTAVITYIGQTFEMGQRQITVRSSKNGDLVIDGTDFHGVAERPVRIAPDTLIKIRTI